MADEDESQGSDLTWHTKLFYGQGQFGAFAVMEAMSIMLLYFYSPSPSSPLPIVLGAGLVGIALGVGSVVDAVVNPIVGYYGDQLKTRWGRRRPFLLFAAIPFGISFMLLWTPPVDYPDDIGFGGVSASGPVVFANETLTVHAVVANYGSYTEEFTVEATTVRLGTDVSGLFDMNTEPGTGYVGTTEYRSELLAAGTVTNTSRHPTELGFGKKSLMTISVDTGRSAEGSAVGGHYATVLELTRSDEPLSDAEEGNNVAVCYYTVQDDAMMENVSHPQFVSVAEPVQELVASNDPTILNQLSCELAFPNGSTQNGSETYRVSCSVRHGTDRGAQAAVAPFLSSGKIIFESNQTVSAADIQQSPGTRLNWTVPLDHAEVRLRTLTVEYVIWSEGDENGSDASDAELIQLHQSFITVDDNVRVENQDPLPTFIYLIVIMILFSAMYSCILNPYLSLLPELAEPGTNERVELNTWKNLFTLLGMAFGLVGSFFLGYSLGFPLMGVILGAVSITTVLLTFAGVRERTDYVPDDTGPTLRYALTETFKNKQFLIHIAYYMVMMFGFRILIAGIPYILTELLQMEGDYMPLGVTIISALAFLPLVFKMTERLGRKRSLMIILLAWTVILPFVAILGYSPIPAYIVGMAIFVAIGFPLAGQFLLPDTILSDIVDLDEVRTGYRREGMYFGVQGFIIKLGSAGGIAFVGWELQLLGSGAHDLGLILLGPIGAGCTLVSLLILSRLRVREDMKREEIDKIKRKR